MPLRAMLAVFAFVTLAAAGPVPGIHVSDQWRYFKGVSEPSTNSDWRLADFDDSQWQVGSSGFTAGFSATEATSLGSMAEGWFSAYFRKAFTLDDRESAKWLTLRIDYAQGFVAFINGREIARRNLPGLPDAPVPYNVGATNVHPQWSTEEIDVSGSIPFLKSGTNILAIQVHSTGPNDYGLVAVPELLVNFQRGPFIQNMTSNSVQVIWKTPVPTDAAVEFGTNATALLSLVHDTNLTVLHSLTLTNLSPDTEYHYQVKSSDNQQTAVSPQAPFHTLKTDGALSFVVFGDSGSGSAASYSVANVVQSQPVDLVMHVGDAIYPGFTDALADTHCLSVFLPHMRSVPYYFAIGNHDLYATDAPFLNAFFLPTNSATGTEHYYSFDHGDAHFIVLFQPFFSQYFIKLGDAQYEWLAADLASSKKPWKFIFLHLPLNSSSAHRRDDYNYNGIQDRLELSDLILPLAVKYGVQIIFSGHDHGYERFKPAAGVHLIVTGGGGAGLYPQLERDPSSAQYWIQNHCLRVTVNGPRLSLDALDTGGSVFDSMTISREPDAAVAHNASWHAPQSPDGLPDDGDGNRIGQTFDLIGSPITSVTGLFSNLGQLYVNNDATNLYLGLKECTIYPNNDILLFIESPKVSGITNLLQIGDGIADPLGQGADALDFLANLSFTNFAPSVACILGNEYEDRQDRSFARTNLPFSSGQGVFRLNTAIDDLPGCAVEQFNRSPQLSVVPGDEEADFIVVTIPFSSLGGIAPGDSIKVGAVVGGSQIDPAHQTRQLDGGFIGNRFVDLGNGQFALEGADVILASLDDPDHDGLTTEEEKIIGTSPLIGDTDQDGLPDGWEVHFHLDPLSPTGDNGPDGDPDRDGFSNRSELIAGTSPSDASSKLSISIQNLANAHCKIVWVTVPGKRYHLEVTSNLAEKFAEIAEAEVTAGKDQFEASYLEALPNNNDASHPRFFRVRVDP